MPELPELMNSPLLLLIAAVFAIFIIIGIIKHAWRFLIWIAVIVALLLWLGVTNVPQLRDWFEKLLKMVEW